MKSFKTYFKRGLVKFRRARQKAIKKIETSEPLDQVQSTAVSIAKKMICNKNSELIHAPISGTFFVEHSHYYIRFNDNAISVTNGKFSYYVWLPGEKSDELKKLFYRITETRSRKLEKRYEESTLKNLMEISSTLESDTEQ